jgi:hypothetical protein
MRLDLRLHGTTADGKACRADVSVYAKSAKDLQEQADHAARSAAWEYADPPHDPVPEGSHITIERVEQV